MRAYFDGLRAGEAVRNDDPQPRLAAEFFALFRADRVSSSGRIALSAAFAMWGNTTIADAVTQALAELDTDADYWPAVLHGALNCYARSGRRTEILRLLCTCETRLTQPRSRSAVLLLLAPHHIRTGESGMARRRYEDVIALGASPRDVQTAEGALYEMDNLYPGMPAPEFQATTIEGETVRLADFRGREVCLDFWATGCGPCMAELPTLRAIQAEFARDELQLIGISSDTDEMQLRAVMEREQLTWPQIREPVRWDGALPAFGPIVKRYNVWGVPRTFLIDREGRIAGKDLRGEQLVNAVRRQVRGP